MVRPNVAALWGQRLRDIISKAVAERDRSECWLDWPGHYVNGYPFLSQRRVSTWAMEADGRPWHPPLGSHALHAAGCDTRACWNPDHAYWGTGRQNVLDAHERGQQPRGEDRRNAKLTEDDVREIRRLFAPRPLQRDVAARFGITQATVGRIARRESWSWVQD